MEKKLFYLFFRYSCSACLLLCVGQKKSSHLISFKKKKKKRSECLQSFLERTTDEHATFQFDTVWVSTYGKMCVKRVRYV